MSGAARPGGIALPFAVAAAGIALFSLMDALMKGLSLSIGTYNALLWRTGAGAVLGGIVFAALRLPRPSPAAMRLHLRRGILSIFIALTFFWGLARVPMAQAIALAFIAPIISLFLAAILLGERIERRAIAASLLGLAGILTIFAGQARADLGRDALLGSLSILLSSALYGYNIILMRQQAQVARPMEVAFFISAIMTAGYLTAAPFLAELPPPSAWPAILAGAALAFFSLILLSWAYARAQAQHLAPVEYTSFIWAAALGWLVFGEPVMPWTLAGAALIVIACLIAAGRRAPPDPDVETGVHA